jgi:hypothetical protein
MHTRNWLLACCLLTVVNIRLVAQSAPATVDICVYGGSSAGVIAAYTAAKLGKSVLLIEPGAHLGGLTAGGLGFTDIGNKYAVTGVSRDFYRRVGKHYGKFEQWIFEPHVAEEIFQDYVKEAAITVWYNARIVSAKKLDGTVSSIVLENTSAPSVATNRTVNAKIFIDCTYEGDLMARAGISYTVGREDNSTYNETYNGFQLRDKHQFADGIDPYKVKGDPKSGLLWGISTDAPAPEGTGDKKVQAYNFRICLSSDPDNSEPITRPNNYDATHYELLIRVFEKQPDKPFNLILKPDGMPNQKLDINNNGPFSTDMIGMNYNYPEANYAEREQILRRLEEYNKGFLYFLGHDPRVPERIRQEMLRWGYPKDEYVTTGHWSHQAYIRETRRMIGEYVMTQDNCQGKAVVDDGVGMAAYTMDSHNVQRLVVNGMVKNEGDVQIGGFPPYPISYRAIVPKSEDAKNVFVPVCLSASHIAYGSIRMEPVFMVLAQSAATAAVQAIDLNSSVQEVNISDLKESLLTNPLADASIREILVDNESPGVELMGKWTHEKNTRGCYGPSLFTALTSENTTPATARFHAIIEQPGTYEVYAYFPKAAGNSTVVNCVFNDGTKDYPLTLKPGDVPIVGQTSGEWISVGKYKLQKGSMPHLDITTSGADGIVVADAILFYPVR